MLSWARDGTLQLLKSMLTLSVLSPCPLKETTGREPDSSSLERL